MKRLIWKTKQKCCSHLETFTQPSRDFYCEVMLVASIQECETQDPDWWDTTWSSWLFGCEVERSAPPSRSWAEGESSSVLKAPILTPAHLCMACLPTDSEVRGTQRSGLITVGSEVRLISALLPRSDAGSLLDCRHVYALNKNAFRLNSRVNLWNKPVSTGTCFTLDFPEKESRKTCFCTVAVKCMLNWTRVSSFRAVWKTVAAKRVTQLGFLSFLQYLAIEYDPIWSMNNCNCHVFVEHVIINSKCCGTNSRENLVETVQEGFGTMFTELLLFQSISIGFMCGLWSTFMTLCSRKPGNSEGCPYVPL